MTRRRGRCCATCAPASWPGCSATEIPPSPGQPRPELMTVYLRYTSYTRLTAMTADDQLAGFLAKYTPEVAAQAEDALAKMRQRLPNAFQMVYDNYNALVIGFGPTERPSEAIFSIVVYPRYVSLCFLQGATQGLSDPQKLLQGGGNTVRHIRLDSAATLDEPAVQQLMEQSLELAMVPLEPSAQGGLFIRSISAKQRPRRPT